MLGVSGIFSDLDVKVTLDAPIGSMTWYGIGGSADVLLRPNSIEALSTLVKRCRRSSTPMRILGRGANLLVADEGVDGVVIQLDTKPFTKITFDDKGESIILTAMAGADLASTIMECARRGYGGLCQMAGIPSSFGGAIRMNAGGIYGTISDSILSIKCLTKGGAVVTYPVEEIKFSYRSSNIPDPIILGATFELKAEDPIEVRQRVKDIFAYKKSTQPLAEHSAGCSYKNPIDPEIEERVSAGKLIDEAGLKGKRVGGASVSSHHANFITVTGGTKADDVIKLMEKVRAEVYKHCGIELENEVVVWKRGQGGTL